MKEFTLPFDDNPVSSQYLHHAITLGIVQGNSNEFGNDATPWLCGKFNNCYYSKDNNNVTKFNILISDADAIEDGIIQQIHFDIKKSEIEDPHMLFQLIKTLITNGYYICGKFNEKYIPDMPSYNKYDFDHIYFLFGYSERNEFIAAGYLADKYRKYRVNINDYLNGILRTEGDIVPLVLKKYNYNVTYHVNHPRIIITLEDYLCSTEHGEKSNNSIVYGISAIRELSNYYNSSVNKEEFVDVRYSRGLMDMKKIFIGTIKFLFEYYSLEIKNYLDLAIQVYEAAVLIHNLGIKYCKTHDKHIICRIQELFEFIMKIELQYLPCVLNDLKNVVP